MEKSKNPAVLNQIFSYIQILKQDKALKNSNIENTIRFAGTLDDKQANAMQELIAAEFNNIEGEW